MEDYVNVDIKLMRQWKSTLTCLFHSFDQQLSKSLETMEERFTGEKSSIPIGCLIGTPIKKCGHHFVFGAPTLLL